MAVESREIYYQDEIFAASIHGTAQDAVKDFVDTITAEDEIVAPKPGSTILVRERETGDDWFDEWFEVVV